MTIGLQFSISIPEYTSILFEDIREVRVLGGKITTKDISGTVSMSIGDALHQGHSLTKSSLQVL